MSNPADKPPTAQSATTTNPEARGSMEESKTLRAELDVLKKDYEALTKSSAAKIADLAQKLKLAKSAPVGNFVQLDGITYPVLLVVRADQNFEEVKKRHIEEGAAMVVIDRKH